jgi:hypothetical protein
MIAITGFFYTHMPQPLLFEQVFRKLGTRTRKGRVRRTEALQNAFGMPLWQVKCDSNQANRNQ